MAGLFESSSLYNLLKDYNYLPKIKTEFLNPGNIGQYDGMDNRISLSPALKDQVPEATHRTLTHEMAHSVQSLLANRIYNMPSLAFLRSPEEQQLYLAYQKFKEQPLLSSKDKTDKYRSSVEERGGFGAGNMSTTLENDYPSSSHVDPTEATQLSILMDLYRRASPKQQLVNPSYKDPFTPTIK